MATARGVIYFVQGVDGGPIKIGFSEDHVARMKALQAHSPVSLRLLGVGVGTIFEEKVIHEDLSEHRLHGEWFADCPAVRDALATLAPPPEVEDDERVTTHEDVDQMVEFFARALHDMVDRDLKRRARKAA